MSTFKNCLIYQGAHYDGSWKSKFFVVYRTYGLFIGLVQYSLTTIKATQSGDFMKVVESLHWVADFFIILVMNLSCLYNSHLFVKMDTTINDGYFNYGGQLTNEQIKVRIDINRRIQLLSNSYLLLSYCALLATFLKVIFASEEYPLPYPMWMPHEITNVYVYIGTMLHVWIVAETLGFAAFVHWSTFLALSSHLIAQYKILVLAIQEIDFIARNKGGLKEKENAMLDKLKGCAQHHIIIIKYFEDLQKFFNVPLLATAFCITVTICTLGLVVLASSASLPLIGGLLILLLPESFVVGVYCIYGQKIADSCEELGDTIYNSEWYTKPLSVQKEILIMLIGSRKIRQLTGMGLHEFSMTGLSEILKATFSYFNMLRAMQKI